MESSNFSKCFCTSLLDSETGKVKEHRADAHEFVPYFLYLFLLFKVPFRSPINRVHTLNANTIATGDDDGVIKVCVSLQSVTG